MQTEHTLSRRGFVASAGLALAGAYLMPAAAARAAGEAEGPVQMIRRAGPAAKLLVHPLRGNVSVIEGSGGNIAVLSGADGKLLVDAGVSEANVRAALDGIGPGPVRYVVNSHWHFDHTDGNAWLHAAGATIVAHENTRRRMSVATRVEGWDFTFPPSPAAALPTVVIGGDTTLHVNATAVALRPYAPGHTDTDVRVTFAEADVVHVGDTWWNGHYPFIDYSTGGGIDGTIRAAEANVDVVTDRTLVIPGHGPVGDKKQLTEFRDLLRSVRDAVARLKKAGKSADEAVAAKPTAAYDAKWGTFVITPEVFTRLVYAGV
ncbi:MAG TPA: MBL fold metallo-hydrolase [Tepidisphaeraceae bacterium]|jgi:glyoxylase-like metal-dependent hydrolase (beta-lactamase superfamily II)